MRKLISIFLFMFSCIIINAQKMQDILCLKNGSVIRGTIIEAIPNESVKIRTKDGSLFVYKMDEVSKMTKEEKHEANYKYLGAKKGYVGFVELSYGLRVSEYGYGRVSITTTHGYQFNPYIYAGIGGGIDIKSDIIPVFADGRFTLDKRFSPYLDLKIGLNADNTEFYFSPTVGYRFGLKNKMAINVGLSYEYTRFRKSHTSSTREYDSILKKYVTNYDYYYTKEPNCAFCLRANFEF